MCRTTTWEGWSMVCNRRQGEERTSCHRLTMVCAGVCHLQWDRDADICYTNVGFGIRIWCKSEGNSRHHIRRQTGKEGTSSDESMHPQRRSGQQPTTAATLVLCLDSILHPFSQDSFLTYTPQTQSPHRDWSKGVYWPPRRGSLHLSHHNAAPRRPIHIL